MLLIITFWLRNENNQIESERDKKTCRNENNQIENERDRKTCCSGVNKLNCCGSG